MQKPYNMRKIDRGLIQHAEPEHHEEALGSVKRDVELHKKNAELVIQIIFIKQFKILARWKMLTDVALRGVHYISSHRW